MKKFRLSYILIPVAIVFSVIASHSHFTFFDESDARLLLIVLSTGLFVKNIKLQNKISETQNS